MDFRITQKSAPICLVVAILLTGLVVFFPKATHMPMQPPVIRDLPAIQSADTLRVIMENHPLSYYLYKGTRRGFEFELIRKFAEEEGLFIEVVVPPKWSDMIPWLYEGKGDVIAAQMSITDDRSAKVAFTRPYLEVHQVALGTDDTLPPMTPEEFGGRRVLVQKGSAYEEQLVKLQLSGVNVKIDYLDEENEVDDHVQFVARGRHPLTVVDNTIAQLERQFYPGLVVGAQVSESDSIAWAVRPNAPDLLTKLNKFLDDYDRSAYFNILKRRYFDSPNRFLKHRSAQISLVQQGKLSPYDELFQTAGDESSIDWRLLAAQSYHESRFATDKVSWAGAVGLMQLMPRTGRSVGVQDLYDPEENVRGGARYLRQLFRLYESIPDPMDRVRFTLAAYNAGPTHVRNARQLAALEGKNSNAWEPISEALVQLEKPEIYKQEGFDFVRGRAVVRYVDDVLDRWDIFRSIVHDDVLDSQLVQLSPMESVEGTALEKSVLIQ